MTLFDRLKSACADDWTAYVDHPFVVGLADGSLDEASFRHYLLQDYVFLIHFARAYALAAYKADTLADIQVAAAVLTGIVDVEMELHVKFCADWGLTREDMERTEEATANIAYTRFVLEAGHAGDLLELYVALSPCVIGYGEIGRRLAEDPHTKRDGNPYWPWIEMYAGHEYQQVAETAVAQLDRLAAQVLTESRFNKLVALFRKATRLEAGFWQMGLDRSV